MGAQIARSVAERVLSDFKVSSAPVDVERIAKGKGLQILREDLGEVSGLLVSRGETGVICIHKGHSKERQRFTLAHELGHFLLGHPGDAGEQVHVDRGYTVSLRNSRSTTGDDLKEVEANQFAATLLMPAGIVRAELARISDGRGVTDEVIDRLARAFNVSEQAMTIRLSSLGLIR